MKPDRVFSPRLSCIRTNYGGISVKLRRSVQRIEYAFGPFSFGLLGPNLIQIMIQLRRQDHMPNFIYLACFSIEFTKPGIDKPEDRTEHHFMPLRL
ncbi:hypothetical protein AVEN_152849-1 [Araneus ventricosus]|uniref:Uncharacterized protein n=1 Tax=Araneus ventricosus TaxID=182803 RepID=A0A4Y2ADD1_ARAVE|nr:hypothetical protein AVEN_152849-1 [Araneus ventricosus]